MPLTSSQLVDHEYMSLQLARVEPLLGGVNDMVSTYDLDRIHEESQVLNIQDLLSCHYSVGHVNLLRSSRYMVGSSKGATKESQILCEMIRLERYSYYVTYIYIMLRDSGLNNAHDLVTAMSLSRPDMSETTFDTTSSHNLYCPSATTFNRA